MKTAPAQVCDEKGNPLFGTYSGVMGTCSLQKVAGEKKFYRHKRWHYQVIITHEVVVLYAIVNLNYASSAFLTALDLKTGGVLDRSFLGLPFLSEVSISDESARGLKASFKGRGTDLEVAGDGKKFFFNACERNLNLSAEISVDVSQALTVIAPVPNGLVNVTQKLIASGVEGSLSFQGKSYDLAGGLVGLDYTQGYLARRTCWRWAMGMGHLPDGTPFGFNLVAGINEGPVTSENGFWVGGKLYPLGKASFEWNENDLMAPWKIKVEDRKINLEFIPKFIHQETKNLILIKSSFAQPVGVFSGTVELSDRSFSFSGAGGVTEFQDSTW